MAGGARREPANRRANLAMVVRQSRLIAQKKQRRVAHPPSSFGKLFFALKVEFLRLRTLSPTLQ
jgi:hypothetical protein